METSDRNFNPEDCGEQCGGNPFETTTSYCKKGQKCCPSGQFEEECSPKCGPYDPNGKTLQFKKTLEASARFSSY